MLERSFSAYIQGQEHHLARIAEPEILKRRVDALTTPG
jgi:hypothetical protein